MKKKFVSKWKGSKQPRKQRKYWHNAPAHIRGDFLNAHLSKELAKKHGIKRMRIRVGDKVKIMRGKFRGRENKVEAVDLKKSKVLVSSIEVSKKDGSKSRPFIHASNLLITELNMDDKKRMEKKEQREQKEKKVQKVQKEQKE
jgi:large subunit ribosomal protein L24